MRELPSDKLADLIQNAYTNEVYSFDDSNEKLLQSEQIAEFQNNTIPDFHLMLCREIIEYTIKKTQLPIFKLIFGTYAIATAKYMIGRVNEIEQYSFMFVRRICMTDWVEAYNWASKQISVKGFAKSA